MGKGNKDRSDPTRELRNVVEVTDEDFYDIIGQDQFVLLEIYASWCGHCRDLVDTYAGLANFVASDSKLRGKVVVAKLNGETARRTSKRLQVTGYPTLLLFAPHKTTPKLEHNGNRDINELIDFLNLHTA